MLERSDDEPATPLNYELLQNPSGQVIALTPAPVPEPAPEEESREEESVLGEALAV